MRITSGAYFLPDSYDKKLKNPYQSEECSSLVVFLFLKISHKIAKRNYLVVGTVLYFDFPYLSIQSRPINRYEILNRYDFLMIIYDFPKK